MRVEGQQPDQRLLREFRYMIATESSVGPHGLDGDLWNGLIHIERALESCSDGNEQLWDEGIKRLREMLPQVRGFRSYYQFQVNNYNHMEREAGRPEVDVNSLVDINSKFTTPEVIEKYDGLVEELKSQAPELGKGNDKDVVNRCIEIMRQLKDLVYGTDRRWRLQPIQ